ncbi:hypothetical protein THZG08_850003 [Vibrio owensii]|nr:hypothetical protein THZG08_850003 [Vibrio owensii]CAH1593217.1 hypothetical protein THOA03_840003 [Vibrio owensii]
MITKFNIFPKSIIYFHNVTPLISIYYEKDKLVVIIEKLVVGNIILLTLLTIPPPLELTTHKYNKNLVN